MLRKLRHTRCIETTYGTIKVVSANSVNFERYRGISRRKADTISFVYDLNDDRSDYPTVGIPSKEDHTYQSDALYYTSAMEACKPVVIITNQPKPITVDIKLNIKVTVELES